MIWTKQKIFQKRIYLCYLTLVVMFLEHFTEESVIPQKKLVCIASNVYKNTSLNVYVLQHYYSLSNLTTYKTKLRTSQPQKCKKFIIIF